MNNWLLGFFLIFFFIFPTNNIFFAVNILFIYLSFSYRRLKLINKPALIFIGIAVFAFIINLSDMTSSLLLKESFRLFVLVSFLLMMPIKYHKVNYSFISKCLFFALSVVFISQVAFLLNIRPIVNFVDLYFPYEGDALGLTTDYIISRASGSFSDISVRFSGIYRNPNQCSRYVLLLVSGILYMSNSRLRYVTIVIAFFSLLMTGSRTGLVVLFVIVIAYLYFVVRKSFKYDWLIFLLIPILILALPSSFENNRAFAISEGMNDSFATKFVWFWGYIVQENNIFYLLFGHGTTASVTDYKVPMLDSEWGMAIFSYGIVGFIAYVSMLVVYFRKSPKSSRMFFVNLLWIITSTMFLSYRASIVFSILFSLVWFRGSELELNLNSKRLNK